LTRRTGSNVLVPNLVESAIRPASLTGTGA
jgi:hypothetical protein